MCCGMLLIGEQCRTLNCQAQICCHRLEEALILGQTNFACRKRGVQATGAAPQSAVTYNESVVNEDGEDGGDTWVAKILSLDVKDLHMLLNCGGVQFCLPC